MLESQFQRELIKELKNRFPGCIVLKNDSSYIQGIPDLIFLWEDRWAAFEVKKSANASARPNQKFYVNKMNQMSLAYFIYPENKERVLNEIQRAFGVDRRTRILEC